MNETHLHFFQEAPGLSWWSWIQRSILQSPIQPTFFKERISTTNIPSPTGIKASLIQFQEAPEIARFLELFYYSQDLPIQLKVPHVVLAHLLKNTACKGVSLRDGQKRLVGVVFCFPAGIYKGQPMGLITWLCVHPQWRKRGVTNCLLRTMYKLVAPTFVFWWRNDGSVKSPLPAIYTTYRYLRKKNTHLLAHRLQRVKHSSWKDSLKQSWIQDQPTGLVLDGQDTLLLEVWQTVGIQSYQVLLVIQPTFEVQRVTQEHWCEIIAWSISSKQPMTDYEKGMAIESTLNGLAYDWFDVPHTMPRLESFWQSGGTSSWSAIGLDVGYPLERPILPLVSA